ncbi:MAG: hypothetical protein M3Y91_04070 [Actinomycetota bacterium]|nr:hypothetical protein [Actinomycetota bacterium]
MTLASLTAGCGGSTKVSGPSTSATTATGQAAFVSCMEKQGIPGTAATSLAGRRGRAGGAGGPGGSAPGSAPAGSDGSGRATTPSLSAGVTQAQLRAALQACRSLLPAGAGFGRGVTSPAAAAYRNCLRLHGVTFPAPGSRTSTTTVAGSSTTTPASTTTSSTTTAGGGPGTGGRGLGGLDTSNPTVQAALTACAPLRPAPGGTTTSSTTGASS